MYKALRIGLVLTFLLLTSVGAYAATNIYKDTYTTEDSTGAWTFASIEPTKVLNNIEIISATPATLTTASAGKTYIVDFPNLSTIENTIVSITLPPASGTTSKVTYKFVSGDGSGIVIRPSDEAKDNIFMWGYNGTSEVIPTTQKQLRCPIGIIGAPTTGTTVQVTMGSNVWYVDCATQTTLQVEAVTAI